jgi:riboflavin kinase/FMN adenylyltransferase
MRVIRGLHNLAGQFAGCVATIGNFDGVHLGHQKVVRQLAEKGQQLGLPVVVAVFEPQPMEFFKPDQAPARLSRFREKIQQLSALPVDAVLILEFNKKFSELKAADFIKEVLVDGLKVKHLMIGDDFHFGLRRQGDFFLLKKEGATFGFSVESMNSHLVESERVSSTLIREALGRGALGRAAVYLGRNYSICGRIVQGNQIGRSIGFPTANIKVNRKKSPIQGVFAVKMSGISGRLISGVANVGIRPTLEGDKQLLLEVHLFDFDEDIYGRHVEVQFIKKIRSEQKFDSFDELKKQIKKDSEVARLATASLTT